jgi:iron complex transport system substrate-binding protein
MFKGGCPSFSFPTRIVCLTAETTETLYLLGQEHRIAGISGYTTRPARARREKSKVSAFTSARIDKILKLKPDLVLGFSDLQADIARELVQAGIEVHVFNQRDVAGILRMILTVGAMVGAGDEARRLVDGLSAHLKKIRDETGSFPRRPRVYFEEWDNPMISGIRWISELIEIAGGEDCFPDLSARPLARDRIIADAGEVIGRRPDIIIGSWCGKRFRPDVVRMRPGWDRIPAVARQQIFEIKSALILQPGPAALTDGVDALARIIRQSSA